jgi:hypothetical protein
MTLLLLLLLSEYTTNALEDAHGGVNVYENENENTMLRGHRQMADASGSYLGCFQDGAIRDLGFRLQDNLSIDECIQGCGEDGYSFAGMQTTFSYSYAGFQSSYVCYCDDDFGMYGAALDCDIPCPSGEGMMCGGVWANSVYSTSISGLQATIDELETRNDKLQDTISDLESVAAPSESTQSRIEVFEKIFAYHSAGVAIDGTPQRDALIWLADADPLQLPLDTQLTQLLERYSLAFLYEATGGSDWVANTNWKSGAPTCEWYGVYCHSGVLVDLDLGKLNRTVVSHCVQSSNTNTLT